MRVGESFVDRTGNANMAIAIYLLTMAGLFTATFFCARARIRRAAQWRRRQRETWPGGE